MLLAVNLTNGSSVFFIRNIKGDLMENKTKWYRDPDVITKIIAVAFLVLLGCCIHFFAQDFFDKTLKLAISGNVNALAEYLRSFGPCCSPG